MYFCCFICNLKLDTIYIKCSACNEDICLKCFSHGLEKDAHTNTHEYQVVNTEHIQTFDEWSLKRELDLLDQIEAASKEVFFLNETTDRHVKTHIEKWHNMFLDHDVVSDTVDSFSKFLNEFYSVKTVYKLKRIDSDLSASRSIPLRPIELSAQFRKLNGYRAARGDFETELNDKFEFKLVADLTLEDDLEDDEFDTELVLSVIAAYNELIRERYERKKFVRRFGLLNECSNSNQLALSQFSEQIIKLESNSEFLKQSQLLKYEKFFDSFEDYVKFVELYNHQISLVRRIEELESFRRMGIGRLNHVEPYKHVKLKRLNKTQSVYMSSLVACLNRGYEKKTLSNNEHLKEWFKQMCISEKSMSSSSISNLISDITKKPLTQFQAQTLIKHKNNPLQIENYPDFDKLNEDEKEFCRVSRIQPAVFLKVKTVLMIENQKAGQCTYSRARKIAGIDVNKTRVIHSYMINNKLIRVSNQETS